MRRSRRRPLPDTVGATGRGWRRVGFRTLDLRPARFHGGSVDIEASIAFHQGLGRPLVAYVVIQPGAPALPIGMHMHPSAALGREIEEWYIIIDGTGIQRFTNGDSVEFGPGDLIAVYPGTGHSLEVTGDRAVRLVAVQPEAGGAEGADWAEPGPPRIRVLTMSDEFNPLTAECAECGSTWKQPRGDFGSNSLPGWAANHGCTSPVPTVNLRLDERSE